MLKNYTPLHNDEVLLMSPLEATLHLSQHQLFETTRYKSKDHSHISAQEVPLKEAYALVTAVVKTAVHKEPRWKTEVVISKVFALKRTT